MRKTVAEIRQILAEAGAELSLATNEGAAEWNAVSLMLEAQKAMLDRLEQVLEDFGRH